MGVQRLHLAGGRSHVMVGVNGLSSVVPHHVPPIAATRNEPGTMTAAVVAAPAAVGRLVRPAVPAAVADAHVAMGAGMESAVVVPAAATAARAAAAGLVAAASGQAPASVAAGSARPTAANATAETRPRALPPRAPNRAPPSEHATRRRPLARQHAAPRQRRLLQLLRRAPPHVYSHRHATPSHGARRPTRSMRVGWPTEPSAAAS